ncbi:hypothetical protein L1987_80900 [Smallanthus sonchifolius]|uniref:Uncharacterized protein n=1 Tax=Smallanthus sonchifolius TaxID=185202 RepID=A0ACB8YQ20_9ASTR|nr:hypothetical protein L1987_80900 [Smallanthus sonchifolius]
MRCSPGVVSLIREKLTSNQRVIWENTYFNTWLEARCTIADSVMVHLMLQHEIKSKLNLRRDGLFYVVGGEPLRFGPREFCLITGLRFCKWDGEVPSLESTFKDRVFGGRRMKIEHLEHLYNEDLSHIMDDDMPSFWPKAVSPNEVEADEEWWVKSIAFIKQQERESSEKLDKIMLMMQQLLGSKRKWSSLEDDPTGEPDDPTGEPDNHDEKEAIDYGNEKVVEFNLDAADTPRLSVEIVDEGGKPDDGDGVGAKVDDGVVAQSRTPPSVGRKISAAMKAPLEESDVGISCYISPLSGFRGILKQRYSDFVVNEVDLDGNVVHLTSLEAPTEIAEEPETKMTDQLNGNYGTEIQSFRALAGDSDANYLKEFIDKIGSDVEDGATSIVLSPSSDKVHRTEVHNFFKERLKFLVTDTIDGPEPSSKCVRVRLNSGGNNDRGRGSKKRKGRGDTLYDSRGLDHWPNHLGKFLRFHLCKENKDTQEALGLIGKMLGIQPRSFGFSGTKDKRAVTTQQITVFKQRASKLASLNKRLIGIKVGDFCYVNEGLLLGQLHGNRFTITLRGVAADSEDTVKAAADALGKHGFINYFGMQRFGTGSVPTHLIGAKLLRGEWKVAVSMILDPRDGDILLVYEGCEVILVI